MATHMKRRVVKRQGEFSFEKVDDDAYRISRQGELVGCAVIDKYGTYHIHRIKGNITEKAGHGSKLMADSIRVLDHAN